jgi:hypothetical protein
LSPHYQDALPHGGFNPNNLYSPAYESQDPVRTASLSPAAGVRSNTTAPVLRRTTGLRRRTTRKRTGWRTTRRTTMRTKRAARKRTTRVPVTMISWR